ncbi:preprotein translocase subunit SecG [Bacteroidetes/Chlorobi group bacterium Naka2016]|jgi:preprotein translocase subunit SecG|nr:MAG: preprotein translocase subunit SecG [Bacteroidetes/Chlorobi group bacterium Naka2016]
MFTLFVIIIIIASILLIGVILLQPGKGDLSPTFGGLTTQFGSMFGTQRTMDFLQKTTRILIIILLALSLFANKFLLKSGGTQEIKPVTQGAQIPKSMPSTPPPVEVPKK